MKKSTRILLILSLVFAVCGAAFGIVSACAGFQTADFQEAYKNGELQIALPKRWKEDIHRAVGQVQSSDMDFSSSYTEVDTLELDVVAADCAIIPTESEEWHVSGYGLPASFFCRQDGNTLEIGSKKGFGLSILESIFPVWQDAKLEIKIPAHQIVEKIKIDSGVGNLEMTDGMIRCEEMEIDSGVGDSTIRADITDRLEIDGGVGNLDITLIGEEEDFDYDIDGGVGTVQIGQDMYYEMGSDTKLDNDAEKEIRIDSGVGDVTVRFTKEDYRNTSDADGRSSQKDEELPDLQEIG